MNIFQKIADKKAPYAFLIRFLLVFLVLHYSFFLLWGMSGTGGRIYLPFVANHLNVLKGFSAFLTSCAQGVLRIMGYDAQKFGYNILRINHAHGVIVNPSCLGWSVMSFWVAFVSANSGTFFFKARWVIIGLGGIIVLNVLRIALIALAGYKQWSTYNHLDHHTLFNIVAYSLVFCLIFLFISIHKKHERTIEGNVVGKHKPLGV